MPRTPGRFDEDVILGEVVDVFDDATLDVEIHAEDSRNQGSYGMEEVIQLEGVSSELEGAALVRCRGVLERETLGRVVEFRVHGRDARGCVLASLVHDDEDEAA